MRNACAFALLALSLPLAAQQQQTTITCSSNGNQQFCPANTANGVRMIREQSNNVCRQGSTWSYNRRGITVNNGCSADFEVAPLANGASSEQNNGYNGNGTYNNGNGTNNNGDGTNNNGNNGGNNTGYGTNGYNNNGPNGGNRGRGVVIPSGTQMSVRIEQTLRPSEASQGETVSASLTTDVSVGGTVVAPAGTPVQAQFSSTQGPSFDLRLTSMTLNGREYRLSTNSVHSLRDAANGDPSSQSTKRQLGSILGSVVNGSEIVSGTVFNFRLTSSAQAGGNRGYGNGDNRYGNNPNSNNGNGY